MSTEPRSTTTRNVLRVVGGLLVVVGLAFAIPAAIDLFTNYMGDDFDTPMPGAAQFGPLVGGGFAFVVGIGFLNAGFLGAQARYAAGETNPAVREFGSAFRGEHDDARAEAGGPFCSECGERNGRGAKFCSSCGHAIGG